MKVSPRRFVLRTVVLAVGLALQVWSSRYRCHEIVLDGDPDPDWYGGW